MWAMMSESFLSIVAPHDADKRPDILVVRSRQRGDIERLFPRARVYHTPERDYAYRAYVRRKTVIEAMTNYIHNIEYTNFKNSVTDQARHDAYLDVWNVMYRWGRGLFKRTGVKDTSWLDDYEDDVIGDITGKVITGKGK